MQQAALGYEPAWRMWRDSRDGLVGSPVPELGIRHHGGSRWDDERRELADPAIRGRG